tara:strand:+ start:250 stop:870 length:621 start_codon:yes stop_codon:yes gene_type:complete
MLKKTSIFFCSIFLIFSVQAQNFGGGLILGINTSQVGGDNLGGFDKVGFLVGAFTNTSITELLSVQIEMTYIEKGSRNPNMNDLDHPNYLIEDISSFYFEIPLVLQYHKNKNLRIEGGLLSAYLIDGYYNDLNGKIPTYNMNPFIKYDFGFLLGIDYIFSNKLSLNTRISNSIVPIGTEDYNITAYNSNTKGKYNSALSFVLHYNF